MKWSIASLLVALPLFCTAADYESTLLVQTGKLRESDLIVRTISDLQSDKICLAFYVRTSGTSSVMTCYDAVSGFRSNINQVGFFKEDELIVRKVKDLVNGVACLVAYISTPGTSPAIDCYKSVKPGGDAIVRGGHVREGDLEVHRLSDPDSNKTCLIAYVSAGGTSPSLICYPSRAQPGEGGMVQTSQLREGDLVVRKMIDTPNQKTCLITYVSTEGTSPYMYCFDEGAAVPPSKP
jgi:catabolite regulation protein CreA